MKTQTRLCLSTIILCLGSASALAAPAQADTSGPYVGAAIGRSDFDVRRLSVPKIGSDEHDNAYKIYGGYRFNPHVGIELGHVELGKLHDKFRLGTGATATELRQTIKGRSDYLALTGRLPLGESFALTGKAGVSFGHASGSNRLPASDSLAGYRRSLMTGVGLEWRVNPSVALTLDYENYGKLSRGVKAEALFAGAKFSF